MHTTCNYCVNVPQILCLEREIIYKTARANQNLKRTSLQKWDENYNTLKYNSVQRWKFHSGLQNFSSLFIIDHTTLETDISVLRWKGWMHLLSLDTQRDITSVIGQRVTTTQPEIGNSLDCFRIDLWISYLWPHKGYI